MRSGAQWRLDGERIEAGALRSLIPPGATVFLEQGACEPMLLLRALLEADLDVQLIAAPLAGLNECTFAAPAVSGRLHPKVFAGAPALSEAMRTGAVEYIPCHWSDITSILRARFPLDVALLQVSPPNSEGYCNFGTTACFEQEVAALAKTVIAEVNPKVPCVGGDTGLHQSMIHAYVESHEPLRAMEMAEWGDVEKGIAENVEPLVPDGSTVQVGIGRVPDAVLAKLAGSGKRIRFHSGILTDAMMQVAAAMPTAPGSIVAGMLMGSRKLYAAVDGDPRVSLRNTAHTHSQQVIGGIERFVAINSAIEIDLLGQVNAESVDGRQVAGVGGQLDYLRGARASPGGRSIIAMPSSTRTRSRIVAQLKPGTPVTATRADFDYLVTEHGVAAMRGRTERERAEDLIRIADPQHRRELSQSL